MELTVVRDDLESEREMEIEIEGETVEDLLEQLEVSPEEVLVSVDGTIVSDRHQLEKGSEVKVMDVIAGG